MGIRDEINMVDQRDCLDLITRGHAHIQLRRTAPKQNDGNAGAIVLVDSGTSARLYVKGKKQWWYISLEKE